MQHFWSLHDVHLQHTWLTIGSFDGVHRGHQEIVAQMSAQAHQSGATVVVLTFYPHPSVVLGKRQDPFYLTSPEEKVRLLGTLGVDLVITHPFSRQIASTSAYDFMATLKDHLGMQQLWVGYDFALGRGREGDVPRLREIGQELGYQVHQIEPVEVDGQVISSSLIRSALRQGDVALAAGMLGRPYTIPGEVIHGDGRGRKIGIPTANLEVWSLRALPKSGVYVCKVLVNGRLYGAVTNVGVRPTFENQPPSPQVEAHLFDFDSDLYVETIQDAFLERLRDEQRFPNVQSLIEQIHLDIQHGRALLETV